MCLELYYVVGKLNGGAIVIWWLSLHVDGLDDGSQGDVSIQGL